MITRSKGFRAADIGYEIIAGAGIGITLGVLLLATPYIVEDRDLGKHILEYMRVKRH